MPFWLFKNAVDSLKWICQNGNMMIMMVDHDRQLDLWMFFFSILYPTFDCKELYYKEDEQLDDVGMLDASRKDWALLSWQR